MGWFEAKIFALFLSFSLASSRPEEGFEIFEDPKDCLGVKYLGFFSSCSLKTREKYISFAQFVYFFSEVCLHFKF